ncbi:MAG: DUF3237 domain-containing protein [Acidimicrobiia bacterium]|nr:DUF3237 domain-containing protein [Acidimicrobiia bacterium]
MVGPGADWAVMGTDGFNRLDVRLQLRTDDGVVIYMAIPGCSSTTTRSRPPPPAVRPVMAISTTGRLPARVRACRLCLGQQHPVRGRGSDPALGGRVHGVPGDLTLG